MSRTGTFQNAKYNISIKMLNSCCLYCFCLLNNLVEENKVKTSSLGISCEMHALLQLECEKHKSILAETERTLQKLTTCVQQGKDEWKLKDDES